MWEWDIINHNIAVPISGSVESGELCAIVLRQGENRRLLGAVPGHVKVVLVSVPEDISAFALEVYRADASADGLTDLRAAREFDAGDADGAASSHLFRLYGRETLLGDELPHTVNEGGGAPEEYLARRVGEGGDEIVWASVASVAEERFRPIRQIFLQKSQNGRASVAGLRVRFEHDGGDRSSAAFTPSNGRPARGYGPKIRVDFRSLNVSAEQARAMFRLFWIPSATNKARALPGQKVVCDIGDDGQSDLDFCPKYPPAAPFDVFGIQYWGPGPVEVVTADGAVETAPPSVTKHGTPVTTVACMYAPPGLLSLGPAAIYGPKLAKLLPLLPDDEALRAAAWAVQARIFGQNSLPESPGDRLAPAHAYVAFAGFRQLVADDAMRADVLRALNWLGVYSDKLYDFLRTPELFAAVAHFERLRERLSSRKGASTFSANSRFVERLARFAGEPMPETPSLDEEWATFKRLIG